LHFSSDEAYALEEAAQPDADVLKKDEEPKQEDQ
jgi:hypothetical protein